MGEGIGVATNSKGHVFVYTRSGETRLFEFDQTGAFVREIGQGLYGFAFAHAVRVDKDDNIWAVDEGTNMVIKFSPEGRVVMVLGRRPEAVEGLVAGAGRAPAPPPEPYVFNRPTDVGWDAAGNIFVTDGYGNSRVVKYDKNGRFVKPAGTRGNGRGQLNLPHTMAIDAKGNVYVADRGNARVQVFDNDLNSRRSTTTSASRGRSASRPDRTSTCTARTRCPDNDLAQSGTSPARSTRWSSTARSSASSARPASGSRSSAPCTRWTAATRTRCSSPRSPRGGSRRSSCARSRPGRAGG